MVSPDFSVVTGSVDLSTVGIAVLAVSALLAVPLVFQKSTKIVRKSLGDDMRKTFTHAEAMADPNSFQSWQANGRKLTNAEIERLPDQEGLRPGDMTAYYKANIKKS